MSEWDGSRRLRSYENLDLDENGEGEEEEELGEVDERSRLVGEERTIGKGRSEEGLEEEEEDGRELEYRDTGEGGGRGDILKGVSEMEATQQVW